MKILIYTIFIIIIQQNFVLSKVYYVDKDNKFGNGANNSWPGTKDQPKANLNHDWFKSGLEPGDTVIVAQASSYGSIYMLA